MLFKASFIAAFLAAVATAVPTGSVLHEKRTIPLKQWVKRSPVKHDVLLPMRIGMVQSNLDRGDELMMEVASHNSPKYSQWYTAEEIIELFAPAQAAVDSIRDWLQGSGIEEHRVSQSTNKQWIQFDATPEEAEKLFQTKYYTYEHLPTGNKHVGCDEYHLPAHVSKHVDYVTPGLKLMAGGKASDGSYLSIRNGSPKKRGLSKEKRSIEKRDLEERGFRTNGNTAFSQPSVAQTLSTADLSPVSVGCDQYVTPKCIAQMYNITQAKLAAPGNQLGIFEEGDFYTASDLAEFFTLLAPNIPVTTQPKLEGIDGGFAPLAETPLLGGESDLDFQISYPIIYPQNSILFQTDDIFYALGEEGGGGFLNTFLDALDGSYCTYSAFGETGDASIDPVYPDPNPAGYQGKTQCGVYKPTNVISISYGEQEDDLPTNYQQRQCSEFMKLGMQGVSVVIASGDSGVAARSTDDGNSDGCLGTGQVFNPDFPASCPYITAAGATYLPPGASAAGDQEVAVTRFPSGGGFSNIYPAPSYQQNAVASYFTFEKTKTNYPSYNLTTPTNNPTAAQYGNGIYNKAGRGYPDISAIGDNVVVVVDGQPELIGGTSAAAPAFAAILNRINEERIAAGKKTVGFVNPTLYSNPSVLHDITVGNNSGCGTAGFYASSGWDPVTGLGTPNYPAMLKLFMSLP